MPVRRQVTIGTPRKNQRRNRVPHGGRLASLKRTSSSLSRAGALPGRPMCRFPRRPAAPCARTSGAMSAIRAGRSSAAMARSPERRPLDIVQAGLCRHRDRRDPAHPAACHHGNADHVVKRRAHPRDRSLDAASNRADDAAGPGDGDPVRSADAVRRRRRLSHHRARPRLVLVDWARVRRVPCRATDQRVMAHGPTYKPAPDG